MTTTKLTPDDLFTLAQFATGDSPVAALVAQLLAERECLTDPKLLGQEATEIAQRFVTQVVDRVRGANAEMEINDEDEDEDEEEARQRRAEGLDVILTDTIDTLIDYATDAEKLAILETFGNRDLREPQPALEEGWSRVLGQLAVNALTGAVKAALEGVLAPAVEGAS